MRRWIVAILSLGILGLSRDAVAQVRPDAHWMTLRTTHFYIHFTPELEPQARRLAVNAERAWNELSTVLTPPRAPVDVVLSDATDESNGSAIPFPSNRITLYATPPVNESALRFTDDWNAMLITHELTHVFHLDRARGIWSLGEDVFGRAPELFPNEYGPSWLLEGLAVHMESKFTGGGRIRGSEHTAILRASALDHTFPTIGSASLASTRFPFGEAAYAFGSMFVDHLARDYGDAALKKFVEGSSSELVPFWLDIPAKRASGVSLGSAWKTWSDSIAASMRGDARPPMDGWRALTTDGVFVYAPRWSGDTALTYTGTPGRETTGAYRVMLDGRRRRIGLRNDPTPNLQLPDGELLYSRLQWTGPYELRSDLFRAPIDNAHAEGTRLTSGERLESPDMRARDGAIVAVQIVPAASRIVRVTLGEAPGDTRITPITTGTIDEQYVEPRWSHAGDRIAAIRWQRGGMTSLVVMDSSGNDMRVIDSSHAVLATPDWTPDDSGIVYTSDRTGASQIYLARLTSGSITRLSASRTGIFEPQISPDGRTIAAVELRGDGYHLGVAPCCSPSTQTIDSLIPNAAPPLPTIGIDSSAARSYSPWRTLWPRYWEPSLGTSLANGLMVGALTSGTDVVGRHAYSASIFFPTDDRYVEGGVEYQYAGFGNPIIQLRATQDWSNYASLVDTSGIVVGNLRRRSQDAEASAVIVRRRTRGTLVTSFDAGVERRTYATSPDSLVLDDPSGTFRGSTIPRVSGSVNWSDVQYPAFAISPEDGMSLGLTIRERLRSGITGSGGPSTAAVAAMSGFKSLDLPGFAHHVLAARVAGGISDTRAQGYFDVGGTSGSAIDLVPGYSIGEGAQTFGVRGFPAGSLSGVRAVGGSLEYRAPLAAPGKGLWLIPLFVDRTSFTAFVDAASAWCPDAQAGREVCGPGATERVNRRAIASLGAEFAVNASLLSWDEPYRLRIGVAHPIAGERRVPGVKSVSVFAGVGYQF